MTFQGFLLFTYKLGLGILFRTNNAGDPSSIPWSGSSHGERIGYPLQYSQAPLVAQTVKNPPAMQETWGSIPGLGRSPGGEHATHSNILAWRISMDREAWWATVHEIAMSWTQLDN